MYVQHFVANLEYISLILQELLLLIHFHYILKIFILLNYLTNNWKCFVFIINKILIDIKLAYFKTVYNFSYLHAVYHMGT